MSGHFIPLSAMFVLLCALLQNTSAGKIQKRSMDPLLQYDFDTGRDLRKRFGAIPRNPSVLQWYSEKKKEEVEPEYL